MSEKNIYQEHPINEDGILILNGKAVASSIKQEVIQRVEVAKALYGDRYVKPCLAIVSIGDNKASQTYIRGKTKDCKECGFDSIVIHLAGDISYLDIKNELIDLSKDPTIHGIILQLPLPEQFSKSETRFLLNYINPFKDVDCLTDENVGKLVNGTGILKPCTPDGIMETLKYYNISVSGKDVVIVNRSDIVGKPLATMMNQANATVTLCHSKTKNLAEKMRAADIVVVGVGQENFINNENVVDMLQSQAVVIDVGINRNVEGKLVGDVNYNAVAKTCSASAITPVPGGVGLTTRAALMRNVLIAYENQNVYNNDSYDPVMK